MLRRLSARRTALIVSLATAALMAPAPAFAATEIMFATTTDNQLISFTSQKPGVILSKEPIGGIAPGETIIGMDQRPFTGQIYILTSTGRILIVNQSSGDTKLVTPTPLPLTGTSYGFDFNPTADKIRIVSNTNMNLRVDPDTGVLSATDGVLVYKAGDTNFGANPMIGAAAYSGTTFGTKPASTTLFDIDTGRKALVKQDPPNDGTLNTVGPLGVDPVDPIQFEIAADGKMYAAFGTTDSAPMKLWSIAATGAATPAAQQPALGVTTITSLTSVGKTSDDKTAPFVAVGNYTTYRGVWLDRGLRFTITCTTECEVVSTLRINGVVAGTATSSLMAPGTRAPLITLTAAGRTAAAAPGRVAASLTFVNTDNAGNTRTQVANFTSLFGFNPA